MGAHANSPESLTDLLPPEAVAGRVEAADWRAAIRAAGDLLVSTGSTTPAYTEQMLAVLDRSGPYIVITPGFALAHAEPSDAVLANGMSFVQLAHPVHFGHPANDPVQLIAGLASRDGRAHMGPLLQLARVLSTPGRMQRLRTAASDKELCRLLGVGTVAGTAADREGPRAVAALSQGMER